MTAIAAVLALSSTPLFAQDAGVPDPVPETTTEPVTAAPDPLAPEPAAPEAQPEAPVVTDTASQPAKAAKPAAKAKAAASRPTPTARPSATRSPAIATTAPVAIAPPPAEELIDAPVAAPVDAAPVAAPAATPAETAAVDQAAEMDDMLELAGGACLGLLALAGVGMAMRRRKRRKEEEELEAAKWAIIEASPDVESQPEREPVFARTPAPVHDPVPARTAAQAQGPAAKLPNELDLSSFGPHVQAAYRGPTPDNPSVSLEYRLRRASFLDQKEQDTAEAPARAAKVPTKGNWESRTDSDFLFRRGGTKNSAKPEYQR